MGPDPKTAATRRVLIIHTGGTIGMTSGPRGYQTAPGFLRQTLRGLPAFQDPEMPDGVTPPSRHGTRVRYELLEYAPLLDSSNMGMDHWVQIARDIERHYDEHDAFLVLHGTDTMAYTASALSFMLEGLEKTVIITGSQIPLSQLRNDAEDNLLGALMIAGHYDIPEVCLYFRGRLFRGNRTRKVDASGLRAFDASNEAPLATVGTTIEVDWDRVRAPTGGTLTVLPIDNPNVAVLRLFPGLSQRVLANVLAPPLEGLVLQTYGTGNAPDNRVDFLETLHRASDRGVVIVNVTQCERGTVATHYAAGAALCEAGVIGGGDMTTEAALTKLAFLLSRDLPAEEVRQQISADLRGELTPQDAPQRFSFREKAFVVTVARALGANAMVERREIARALYPVLLCSAAGSGDLDSARRLLEGDTGAAIVNSADYDMRTALHVAAAEGHVDMVAFLLGRGADVRAVDRWGGMPEDDARRNGHAHVLAVLQRARGVSASTGD